MAAVRADNAQRAVDRRFKVSLSTVQLWLTRTVDRRLDRVEWLAGRSGPVVSANRAAPEIEEAVLAMRAQLYRHSALGEHGAAMIRRALVACAGVPAPSERTIGRILTRGGALDGRYRVRRAPLPRGWYVPEVAAQRAALDQFDVVEGLKIKDGPLVEVLNGLSLHGGPGGVLAVRANSLCALCLPGTAGALVRRGLARLRAL